MELLCEMKKKKKNENLEYHAFAYEAESCQLEGKKTNWGNRNKSMKAWIDWLADFFFFFGFYTIIAGLGKLAGQ